MPSQMMDLIEEYRIETMFYQNQSDQWRGLVAAILLTEGIGLDSVDPFLVPLNQLERAKNYLVDAQQDGDDVVVMLTKEPDGS